ncbi:MAG: Pectate disaccharide-lyase [Paracidovorax wautersii]|uniref:Pectate disaccharide-lyase n=1 Tax=Paracidovorax wautersii TaxID=1177982 RepID=A0A7V8FMW0_9BURK|nr:MAG: Pectate disaccharide-lyase [Paracidovorax wautersii]
MLLEGRTSTIYSQNALMQLQLAQDLGPDGADLRRWTLDGLKAFARYAYDETGNTFRPMLANGTDLSNYALRRDGYYGPKGTVFRPYAAGSEFLLSYARAFTLEPDAELWRAARGIALGQGLGDIGQAPGRAVHVDTHTRNSDPYAIFALIDLWRATQDRRYLDVAQTVADNIVRQHLHGGFFMKDARLQYAAIDDIDPYALLALEATLRKQPQAVAPFLNGSGFTEGAYRLPDGRVRVSTRDDELLALKLGQTLAPHGEPSDAPPGWRRDENRERVRSLFSSTPRP